MCFVLPSTRSVSAQVMWSFHRWQENAPDVISESLKIQKIPGGLPPDPQPPLDSRYAQHTHTIHCHPKVTYVDICPPLIIFLNETLLTTWAENDVLIRIPHPVIN